MEPVHDGSSSILLVHFLGHPVSREMRILTSFLSSKTYPKYSIYFWTKIVISVRWCVLHRYQNLFCGMKSCVSLVTKSSALNSFIIALLLREMIFHLAVREYCVVSQIMKKMYDFFWQVPFQRCKFGYRKIHHGFTLGWHSRQTCDDACKKAISHEVGLLSTT